MGLIIQTQRRAIEELFQYNGKTQIELEDKKILTTNGKTLYLLGVSQGFGSCSDVWGVNVAVLAKQNPKKRKFTKAKIVEFTRAVLLHKTNSKEYLLANQNCQTVPFLCVELLHLKTISSDSVTFSLTGKKAFYVPV